MTISRIQKLGLAIFLGVVTGLMNITNSFAQGRMEIDAATYADGVSYFFQGNQYYQLTGSTVQDGYPKPLSEWGNLPAEFTAGIDAALYQPEKKRLYLFKGNQYIRLKGKTVEAGYPAHISQWRGLPTNFKTGIDAALFRNGYTYFFKGKQYVRIKNITVQNGYPADLPGGWGLPNAYSNSNISAAFHHGGRDKNYFFRGENYVRLSDVKMDAKYPRRLNEWKGLQENMPFLDLSKPVSGANNLEYIGANLKVESLTGSSPSDCNQRCQNDNNCSAFTFAPPGAEAGSAKCYLKKGTSNSRYKKGYTSGVMDIAPMGLGEISLENGKRVLGNPYKTEILSRPDPLICRATCAADKKCALFDIDLSSNNPSCKLFASGRIFTAKSKNGVAGFKVPESHSKVDKKLLRAPGLVNAGSCPKSTALDIVNSICDATPLVSCPKKTNTCREERTFLPVGIGKRTKFYTDNAGLKLSREKLEFANGKLLSDAMMCSLRELAPDFKVPDKKHGSIVSKNPPVDLGPLGELNYGQTLDFSSFDPQTQEFVGYRNLSFTAPIIGEFDSVSQKITIKPKKIPVNPTIFLNNSPQKGSGLISKEAAFDNFYTLDITSEQIDQELLVELKPIHIPTPLGPVTVKPKLGYNSYAENVYPPFVQTNERARIKKKANPSVSNAYGVDDAIGFPFMKTGLRGWRSQFGFGNRDPRNNEPRWRDGNGAFRPDYDMQKARTIREKKPSTEVIASAEAKFPDAETLQKFLPDGLRSIADIKFNFLVEPKARAAFSSQFNLVNTNAAIGGKEFTEASEGQLTLQTNAGHAFGFSILTGIDLIVKTGPLTIIDTHPRWPVNLPEASGFTSETRGDFRLKGDAFNRFKTLNGNSYRNGRAQAYLEQCLAKDMKTKFVPRPKQQYTPGNTKELFEQPYPVACNVCVFKSPEQNGTILEVERPWGVKQWQCDAPEKSGCFDLCTFDPKTNKTSFREAAGPDLRIENKLDNTVSRGSDICYGPPLTVIK